jgi:hypothetical protein
VSVVVQLTDTLRVDSAATVSLVGALQLPTPVPVHEVARVYICDVPMWLAIVNDGSAVVRGPSVTPESFGVTVNAGCVTTAVSELQNPVLRIVVWLHPRASNVLAPTTYVSAGVVHETQLPLIVQDGDSLAPLK